MDHSGNAYAYAWVGCELWVVRMQLERRLISRRRRLIDPWLGIDAIMLHFQIARGRVDVAMVRIQCFEGPLHPSSTSVSMQPCAAWSSQRLWAWRSSHGKVSETFVGVLLPSHNVPHGPGNDQWLRSFRTSTDALPVHCNPWTYRAHSRDQCKHRQPATIPTEGVGVPTYSTTIMS